MGFFLLGFNYFKWKNNWMGKSLNFETHRINIYYAYKDTVLGYQGSQIMRMKSQLKNTRYKAMD